MPEPRKVSAEYLKAIGALSTLTGPATTRWASFCREAAGVVPLKRAVVEEMLLQQLADRCASRPSPAPYHAAILGPGMLHG